MQGHKTDANDALAVAIAATQVGMIFSPPKEVEQQSLQTLEKSRKFLGRGLLALSNHMRAFLYEYGVTTNLGYKGLSSTVIAALDDADTRIPQSTRPMLRLLWEQYQQTKIQLKKAEATKASLVKQIEPCKRLMALEGVGEVGAALLYTSLGNGGEFKNGRHASVYVGVTPKQHSSGGKTYMIGIDKNGGNKELRTVLFMGALAFIGRLTETPKTAKEAWLINLVKRAGVKRACIALANKTVRTAWALLSSGRDYEPALLG